MLYRFCPGVAVDAFFKLSYPARTLLTILTKVGWSIYHPELHEGKTKMTNWGHERTLTLTSLCKGTCQLP